VRSYNDESLQRLRFIRRAQQLGFSLKDIRELLELSSSDCEQVEKLAVEKLSLVKAKLRQLRRNRIDPHQDRPTMRHAQRQPALSDHRNTQ
jgi:DNA-binding transcriptional MerR regulator